MTQSLTELINQELQKLINHFSVEIITDEISHAITDLCTLIYQSSQHAIEPKEVTKKLFTLQPTEQQKLICLIARSYFTIEEYQSAAKFYEQLHKMDSKKLQYLYRLGLCYKNTQPDKAIGYFLEVHKHDNGYGECAKYIGDHYLQLQQPELAIHHYNKILIQKKETETLCKLIQCCQQLKLAEQAKMYYRLAVLHGEKDIESIKSNIDQAKKIMNQYPNE